ILFDAINAKDNQFKKEITVSLLSALAMWLNGQISSHVKSKPIALKRADELVSQFLHLLAENFKEKHRLEFYADKLCVTPKYLSAVTRAATNKSAGKLIAFFLMGEAKKMLIASEMTIAQVATELGFPNQSGFGKFFKKEEGLSPSEFRQRI
ncbi:MAG TPA: AraC family transcriptional regulator, partial [Prevotellaceae bacterium]|nr:AraC family transcriptional regulator [Prevotellaceae bacterium]